MLLDELKLQEKKELFGKCHTYALSCNGNVMCRGRPESALQDATVLNSILYREVLVMVMRKHQRYFPIYSKDNQLLPCFVSVANGPVDIDLVSKGKIHTPWKVC